LAEYLAVNKLAYDSVEARTEVDRIMELFAYEAIRSSCNISKER
jgi:ribonucleotide reductase alpha subunit